MLCMQRGFYNRRTTYLLKSTMLDDTDHVCAVAVVCSVTIKIIDACGNNFMFFIFLLHLFLFIII